MATLQTLNDGETGGIVRGKINDNFTAVNSDLSTLDTNKLEASDIATINGNTISAGGNLVIPTLTDGDKGDITITAGVWSIDNDVVTFAKMQNITGDRILGRISGTSGDVGEITGTQINTILPDATTSLGGRMSASDKTKLDGLSNEWAILKNDSFTAGGTYDSGSLTTYDEYKVFIKGYTTGGSAALYMETSTSAANLYNNLRTSTSGGFSKTTGDDELQLFTTTFGIGAPFIGEYFVERSVNCIKGTAIVALDASFNSIYLTNGYVQATFSKIALTLCNNISGTIRIYGRNY